ncbi:MAG TPA: hypothetical protein ENN80_04620, partial [Candidatus Hydrogenedentes bacterium]|nr:hypothetical protein [Candidatus Hydrogenedentota bacterium]
MNVNDLERRLNAREPERRRAALDALCERVARGEIGFPEPRRAVNLHCHTTFSYNGYGYSPTYVAWRARREGLWMAGCIDFDVLDAVDEFLHACRMVGLRGCAGIETRAFVPSFATREMNSPGEPGAAYYCGVGFTSGEPKNPALLHELKETAQHRNRTIMGKVNPHLSPVELDYERDVLPLTPKGNATERHLAEAYSTKAESLIPEPAARAAFWAEKLGVEQAQVEAVLEDPPALQGLVRAKTMKAGGVGYVEARGEDFPELGRVSAFIIEMGA